MDEDLSSFENTNFFQLRASVLSLKFKFVDNEDFIAANQ